MFSDERSRRVVFVSHCILNSNTRADGHAGVAGVNRRVLELLMQLNIGVAQMPCPELMCLGLDRGDVKGGERPVLLENTRIRAGMKSNRSAEVMDAMIAQVVAQVEQYVEHGFSVLGIIGINRSPSCGVDTTTVGNEEVKGEGVFIERLRTSLEAKGFYLNLAGTKVSQIDEALRSIRAMVEKSEATYAKAAGRALSSEFRDA